jgi:hypothetical protein
VAQGRLLVCSSVFLRNARIEARQAGRVLGAQRANLVPARNVSMSDDWLERVDPAGGTVTIGIAT